MLGNGSGHFEKRISIGEECAVLIHRVAIVIQTFVVNRGF
jgi:hypothetical protein